MGKINQGILGGFSGKVGTVVGSTWKSISYMRALAVNVHDAKSEKQLCQRGKFRTVVNFTKTITPFLRVGFQEHEDGRSAVNAATSYLMLHAVEGCADGAVLNFDKVRVSQGSLTAAADASAEVAANKVTFSWTDNSGAGDAQAEDAAMVLAFNKDRQEAVYLLAAASGSHPCRRHRRAPVAHKLGRRSAGHLPGLLQRRRATCVEQHLPAQRRDKHGA